MTTSVRVLVGEDNDNFRDLLAQLLNHEGYDVETVTNGDDLSRAAIERTPQVILADVRLPELPTLEVLRRLRAAKIECAVILMTGALDDATRTEAVELGVLFI